MSRLLDIADLRVTFGRGPAEVRAVRGVSFHVDEGESVALVGESGSGKSVTALSVLQLLPYPAAHHPGGSIRFRGEDLIGARPARLRAIRGDRIAMIFQEPLTSLNPLHAIEKQIAEVLFVHKAMGRKQARARVEELMELVGLEDQIPRLSALPHEFSGGQQQRVMIAMALANEPDLLIADEPTTALDVTVQAQILKLLNELRARLGMSLLLITHDLGIVRHMADRVCVMTDGEIVEQGETERIFRAPAHAYTRRLLAAEPRRRPDPAPAGAPTVMRAEALKVWFPIRKGLIRRTVGHVKAVDGITLDVKRGHTLGVVGESGSGKTTLGRALLRLERSEGAVAFDGRALAGLRARDLRPLRRHMQMVFQDPYGSLSPRLSVMQIVEEGLRVHRIGGDARERRRRVAVHGRRVEPWFSSRRSSSSTSRPRRSTCRSRRRWWTCCGACRRTTTWPTCSSPTTSRWCAPWPTR